ncbi:hypothetical protein GJAV_G00168400 [Gymnothorax javanicus]|nr:hypothetical protein GJAV_G00168400 [Gymnothorax javanicus]
MPSTEPMHCPMLHAVDPVAPLSHSGTGAGLESKALPGSCRTSLRSSGSERLATALLPLDGRSLTTVLFRGPGPGFGDGVQQAAVKLLVQSLWGPAWAAGLVIKSDPRSSHWYSASLQAFTESEWKEWSSAVPLLDPPSQPILRSSSSKLSHSKTELLGKSRPPRTDGRHAGATPAKSNSAGKGSPRTGGGDDAVRRSRSCGRASKETLHFHRRRLPFCGVKPDNWM